MASQNDNRVLYQGRIATRLLRSAANQARHATSGFNSDENSDCSTTHQASSVANQGGSSTRPQISATNQDNSIDDQGSSNTNQTSSGISTLVTTESGFTMLNQPTDDQEYDVEKIVGHWPQKLTNPKDN